MTSGNVFRVALDLRLIRHSGIGSYLSGLLSGFDQIQAPIEWVFIGPRAEIPEGLRVAEWIEFDAPLYSAREYFHYPRRIEADLLHYPHYNLPRTKIARRVVTVHDLFHLRHGSFHKRLYQRLFLRRLAWSGVRIAAISEKTRDELCAWNAMFAERTRVIHLGPGRPAPDRNHRGQQGAIKLSDGRIIQPPWLLAVGIDKSHKNMDFLITAVAMWRLRRGSGPPLIWLGPSEEEITRARARIPAHARQKIAIEPYAAGERVEQFFEGAMGLVFPSLDEGFGFPPLEAMARGVPVLCSRRRPMTDLLGDAPIWFDPEDSATLWRALDRLTDDPGLAAEIAEKGRAQAAKYRWSQTARETFRLYAEVAGREDLLK